MNRRQRILLYKVIKKTKPYIPGLILGTIISLLIYYFMQAPAQTEIISPCPDIGCQVITPTPTATPTPTPKPAKQGKVSYYSHAGCLGCGEKQIMGNGQPFDEMGKTIAVPCEDITSKRVRYGTKVKVENVHTGKYVIAEISDCGGFSKYNRIADVSLGIYQELAIKTDVTEVRIEKL